MIKMKTVAKILVVAILMGGLLYTPEKPSFVKEVYTVKHGDTLWAVLADRTGENVQEAVYETTRLNNGQSQLVPGEKVILVYRK